MKQRIFFLFIVLILFTNSVVNYALTIQLISIEQMTKESNTVIIGKVMSSYSVWEGNKIYTYTTFQINEILKDDGLGEYVVVKQLGGTVGDMTLDVPGTPELTKGEELLLFLRFWKGNYWIHSIVLGKYSIFIEEGNKFAINNLNNIGLIDPVTKRTITDACAIENKFLLTEFVNEIKNFLVKG